MVNRYIKRYSTSLVIREIQTETMRYHFTLTRTAKIKTLTILNIDVEYPATAIFMQSASRK